MKSDKLLEAMLHCTYDADVHMYSLSHILLVALASHSVLMEAESVAY